MTGVINFRRFEERDREAVIALWQMCDLTRPWNDPDKDIDRKLAVQRELFIIAESEGQIIGSIMAGHEGHRGSVNYLAVHSDFRRRGIGNALMQRIENALAEHGCPKINLLIRNTNLDVIQFYQAIGYADTECVSLGKRLIADN